MVHENTRFPAPVRTAHEIIESGAYRQADLGARYCSGTGHNIYGKQPYLADVDHFVILDLGVHMLDVARFLMGEATRLYCQPKTQKPGVAGEDMATIALQHAGGATSVVECSYASPIHPDPFPQLSLQVEGTAAVCASPDIGSTSSRTAKLPKSTSRRRRCPGRRRPGTARRRAFCVWSSTGFNVCVRTVSLKPLAQTASRPMGLCLPLTNLVQLKQAVEPLA